jgi:peroxiredoxin Q/BCP
VTVLGASFDTPEDNGAFARKYGYEGRILSDVDRSVGEAYQTARPPEDDSSSFAKRRTYVIDPEGRIAKAYRVTDIGAHPREVLADLRALGAVPPAPA